MDQSQDQLNQIPHRLCSGFDKASFYCTSEMPFILTAPVSQHCRSRFPSRTNTLDHNIQSSANGYLVNVDIELTSSVHLWSCLLPRPFLSDATFRTPANHFVPS